MLNYGVALLSWQKKTSKEVCSITTLSIIQKRNHAPILRMDEISDLVGKAKALSIIDLKTWSHQFQTKSFEIKKTAFNIAYDQLEYNFMPIWAYNWPAKIDTITNEVSNNCSDRFQCIHWSSSSFQQVHRKSLHDFEGYSHSFTG